MDREKSRTYKAQAEEIRNRLGDRDYVLGGDLGVGSIGIAVVALETIDGEGPYPTDIVYAGSRVFKPSTGAAERRMKRGARNSHRHKSNRLRYLWKVLSEKDLMLPVSDEEVSDPAALRFSEEIRKKDPYEIRLRGLSSELSLHELGYVLYHMANHRGSSSVRSFLEEGGSKEDKKKKDDEKNAAEAAATTKNLAKEYGVDTYIEVLVRYCQEKGEIRFRNNVSKSDASVPVPTRDIIRREAEKLLNTQKSFHPDILTDDFTRHILSAIFYENPKLVPEPGPCPYFPDEKKLPKASFINEERRIWESLNNVRIEYDWTLLNGTPRRARRFPLTYDEKQVLFSYLRNGKDLSGKALKSLLPEYKDCKNVILQGSDKNDMKIKGFRFRALEKWKPFALLTPENKEAFIRNFVNIPDDERLKQYLIDELGFTSADADEAILSVALIGDYAPVGPSAMKILLPLIIEEGLSFQEAEHEAISRNLLAPAVENKVYDLLPYYGEVLPASTQHLMGKAWHSEFEGKWDTEGFIKPYTSMDEEKYGRIANPVVHQTLNELRKYVNEIMTILGRKPSHITIEFGREIKMGAEKREKYSRELATKEKNNNKLFKEYCEPNLLGRKYVRHFRLLEHQGNLCPYCNKPINVSDIVTGYADIDHIFPKDDTFDSSENNLVIAHKHCNEIKNKRIPHTAFAGDVNIWSEIEQYLSQNVGMACKRWRFEMNEEEYRNYLARNSFLSRFKSDNSYVAKIACEYLCSLFPEDKRITSVTTLKGGETAVIRRGWNLNGITDELSSAIRSMKEKEKSEGKGKQREDVRHHALDAIVAAYYTPSVKQLINNQISKVGVAEVANRIPIPKYFRKDSPLSTSEQRKLFRDVVSDFIFNHTFVSRKVDHGKNGSLIKDTQYTIVAAGENDLVFCTRRTLKSLFGSSTSIKKLHGDKADSLECKLTDFVIQKWIPDDQRATIENMLSHNRTLFESVCSMFDETKSELERNRTQNKQEGRKVKDITDADVIESACRKVGGKFYQLENFKRQKVFVAKEPTAAEAGYGFKTNENYCLDFYHDGEGKLKCEVVRLINAVTADYVPEYVKKGYILEERFYTGDILEIDLESSSSHDDVSINSLKSPNSAPERTFAVIATFTEMGDANDGRAQIRMDSILSSQTEYAASKYNTSMQEWNVRKVNLSEAGLVVYRSKILKDIVNVENS